MFWDEGWVMIGCWNSTSCLNLLFGLNSSIFIGYDSYWDSSKYSLFLLTFFISSTQFSFSMLFSFVYNYLLINDLFSMKGDGERNSLKDLEIDFLIERLLGESNDYFGVEWIKLDSIVLIGVDSGDTRDVLKSNYLIF